MIVLPDIPSNAIELEDYVAAFFQAAGCFVQRGVVQRDPTDVLELDAVLTDYNEDPPRVCVAEAKSGDWGYPDIFKVAGWMCYLDIDEGGFFVRRVSERKDLDAIQARAATVGIRVAHLGDTDPTADLAAAGYPEPITSDCVEVLRFVYVIERCLLNCVRQEMRTNPDAQGPRKVWEYFDLVNNSVFFERDDYERLLALYEAYKMHPKLALGVAREIGGGEYDCETEDPGNPVIGEAIYQCKHPVLQACFHMEHRARLAILKAIVDIVLIDLEPKNVSEVDSIKISQLDMLPATAKTAIDELKTHKAVRHYARFWQVFLLGFGGFYLRDRQEDEFKWLEKHSGVPVDEIPNALKAFDIAFPLPRGDSWLIDSYESQCRLVRMVPSALQGMGVYHRKLHYGLESISDFEYDYYTHKDLGKWYDAGYHTLKDYSDLKVEELE